jgi:outer membrane receptor for ferrienterochelin and colicins
VAQVLGHDTEHALTIRLDITNLFDSIYLLHDGTSVGKGQPQYGPRRGVMLGLRKAF